MTQATLSLHTPLSTARKVGQEAQALATERAERDEPGFGDRARALILQKLAAGPASAEDITDYVSERLPMKDGRALGSVYKSLRDRGLIRIAGSCLRAKGRGTAGGHIWERC